MNARKTAALSLSFGILSVLFFCFAGFVYAIPAIVLGHRSRKDMLAKRGERSNYLRGTAGMLLGYASVFLTGVVACYWLPGSLARHEENGSVVLVAVYGGLFLLNSLTVAIAFLVIRYLPHPDRLLGHRFPSERTILGGNIHVCAEDGDSGKVERLLASDKSLISSRDSMGRTPLHRAARGGHVGIIQLLLEYGADIEAKDEYAWTSFHMAAESNKPEAVAILIGQGADLGARDSDLRTPLHRAAEHNSVDAMRVLLDTAAGSLIPAVDNIRRTAKDVAEAMDQREAIAMIEEYE
jgi:hypothetical protein